MDEQTKICTACREEKPLSKFSKDSHTKDGRQYRCRSCMRAYKQANSERLNAQQKTYRQENAERINEYAKRYRQENADSIRAKKKEYRHAHSEAFKERDRNYYQKNKDRLRAQMREWFHNEYKGSPSYRAANARAKSARRSRLANITNDWKPEYEQFLWAMQEGRCACCQCPMTIGSRNGTTVTVDHIVPVILGTGLSLRNVQLLCHSCNASKKAKIIDYRSWVPEEERIYSFDNLERLSDFWSGLPRVENWRP